MINFEKIADKITLGLGSTWSAIIHTVIFFIFLLFWLGGGENEKEGVLIVLTTIVSLEAIYLAIFIQRSTNKQSERLERAVKEIRYNTVAHLEEPLDVVVKDIHETIQDTQKQVQKTHQEVKKATEALESAPTYPDKKV